MSAEDGKGPTSTLKDRVALAGSVIAIIISVVSFFKDNLFGQHVLRASVVAINTMNPEKELRATVLLVNSGKHTEVLYKARFIYSADLNTTGGSLSKEEVGPVVLEPGQATLVELRSPFPSIDDLRQMGRLKEGAGTLHLGVVLDALTPSGDLKEESRIYKITELKFSGNDLVGAKPKPNDTSGLLSLL